MQTVSVFLQQNNPIQRDKFDSIIQDMRGKVQTAPVVIECRAVQQAGCDTFQFISWSKEEYTLETRDIVRTFIALVAAEWVVQVIEPELVQKALSRHPRTELRQRVEEIYPYVKSVFREMDETSRRTSIYQQIHEYLQDNHELYLDGYVRFRLKRYSKDVEEAVEMAIQDYMQDKEYQEFVELLRYFVSIQETKYSVVHVVKGKKQHFQLYDEADEPISVEHVESILGLAADECREEDYLVSALITLAPERIVLHKIEDKHVLVETLKTIFTERISYCSTCAHCLSMRNRLDVKPTSHYNT